MPSKHSMTRFVQMKNKHFQVFKDRTIEMSKIKFMAGVVLATLAISSCTEDALTIGQSLTSEGDQLDMSRNVYYATTQTVVANSVLTDPEDFFFGRVNDPQTKAVVSSDFTSQFYVLSSINISEESNFVNKYDGRAAADSCDIIIYTTLPTFSQDNLSAMQMRLRELQTPIPSERHYSDFDPDSYVRKDANAIDIYHTFTYTNLRDDESKRAESDYTNNIRIALNAPYKARDGVTYNNYGSYILRQYMDHRDRFRNSSLFTRDVCPGFLFEITDGLGFYAAITDIGLRVFYTIDPSKPTNASYVFAGTEEVVQTLRVSNDQQALNKLAAETDYTYLKTPAGLYTEVALPVENILNGHESDSLLATKIVFQKLNNPNPTERDFGTPSTLLMVMKDSLTNFFEQRRVNNDSTSYYTTISSSNTYTFTNVSKLISHMWKKRKVAISKIQAAHPDWTSEQAAAAWKNETDGNGKLVNQNWNKVLLVPISCETSSSSTTPTRIGHNMSLTSTRLVGGKNTPIAVEVVYGKFSK